MAIDAGYGILHGYVPARSLTTIARQTAGLTEVGSNHRAFFSGSSTVHTVGSDAFMLASARLHNRDELTAKLAGSYGPSRDLSDDALLAQAYRCWGEECGLHALGHWSFVVWHAAEQRLVLGRDHLGFAPLYYEVSDQGVSFADSMSTLLEESGTARHLNLAAMAQLSYGQKRDTSSFYSGISKVPPATILTLQAGEVSKKYRYWDPGKVGDVRFASDQEYREAFLEIYREAVKSRLSDDGPFGITLSGGLDSGSTAALAAPLLQERGQRLNAFTWIPEFPTQAEHPGRVTNELENVQRLAQFAGGMDITTVKGFPIDPIDAVQTMLDITEEPSNPLAGWFWYFGVLREAGQHGIKTLLGGEAGNFSVSIAQRESHHSRLRHSFKRAKQRWQAFLRPIDRHPRMIVRPAFSNRVLANVLPADSELRSLWRTAPQPLRSLYNIMQSGGLSLSGELARHFGAHMTIPAMDRRVIDFCYGIPPEQFARNGESRLLIKHAFAGLMPREQLWSTKRGLIASTLEATLADSHERIMAIIDDARQSSIASEALDLDFLEQIACELRETRGRAMTSQGFILLRGLTYASFLQRFSDIGKAR